MKAPRRDPGGAAAEPILAAGGIVLGTGDNLGKIAIVHRARYGGEIGLPKGKSRPGETPIANALREVEEETGFITSVRELAGTTRYKVGATHKLVHYFVMDFERMSSTERDRKEVERVEWVSPTEALKSLTHRDDRNLIAAVFGLSKGKRQ